MSTGTKQVIVVRKDLNMRKGKMCAQASHASMAFLTHDLKPLWSSDTASWLFTSENLSSGQEIAHWLKNSFKKIVVYVNSDEELLEMKGRALDHGLMVHLITDNGATEFHGVPTRTCLAIGPHWDEAFRGVTDHLPLL
jgi:PTH2 family peptidyl-tRNA hydrolase